MRGQNNFDFTRAQTWTFFENFQILAALSRAQEKESIDFTEFSTNV